MGNSSCAFTDTKGNKLKSGRSTGFHLIRSQTGRYTHTVVYPFGNRSDKNGTDKLSFTQDFFDTFHFFSCGVNRPEFARCRSDMNVICPSSY